LGAAAALGLGAAAARAAEGPLGAGEGPSRAFLPLRTTAGEGEGASYMSVPGLMMSSGSVMSPSLSLSLMTGSVAQQAKQRPGVSAHCKLAGSVLQPDEKVSKCSYSSLCASCLLHLRGIAACSQLNGFETTGSAKGLLHVRLVSMTSHCMQETAVCNRCVCQVQHQASLFLGAGLRLGAAFLLSSETVGAAALGLAAAAALGLAAALSLGEGDMMSSSESLQQAAAHFVSDYVDKQCPPACCKAGDIQVRSGKGGL
jgi:hypothetical protein